jgi:hypothetical protein
MRARGFSKGFVKSLPRSIEWPRVLRLLISNVHAASFTRVRFVCDKAMRCSCCAMRIAPILH